MSRTTDRTKEIFEEAFWKLYETKPVGKISIGELTKLAGYNRSTFYAYYLDIYDLLDQCERSVIEVFLIELRRHTVFEQKLDEFQLLLIEGLPAAYDAAAPYITRLLGRHGDPDYSGKLFDAIQNEFAAALQRHDDRYHLLMEYFFHALMQVLVHWDEDGRLIPLSRLMQPFLAALREGDRQIKEGKAASM